MWLTSFLTECDAIAVGLERSRTRRRRLQDSIFYHRIHWFNTPFTLSRSLSDALIKTRRRVEHFNVIGSTFTLIFAARVTAFACNSQLTRQPTIRADDSDARAVVTFLMYLLLLKLSLLTSDWTRRATMMIFFRVDAARVTAFAQDTGRQSDTTICCWSRRLRLLDCCCFSGVFTLLLPTCEWPTWVRATIKKCSARSVDDRRLLQ